MADVLNILIVIHIVLYFLNIFIIFLTSKIERNKRMNIIKGLISVVGIFYTVIVHFITLASLPMQSEI